VQPFIGPLSGPIRERLTLFVNHVLASEPAAVDHLKPHVGSTVLIEPQGLSLPVEGMAPLCWRITPAGLLEEADDAGEAGQTLHLRIDLSQPLSAAALWLAGTRPPVAIEGDAQFAADIAWLMDNLRWDAEGDLARFVGPLAAGPIAAFARQASQGVRMLAGRVLAGFAHADGTAEPRGPGGAL
jgi:ubiquinone biosynthesis protein UbiJ